jgi:cytochrome P450 family 142 subfamily A polypeptide 1
MWELLRHWSERTMTLGGLNMTDGPPYVSHPEVVPVMVDFFTQTAALVEARRAEPRDDLISVWVVQGWESAHVLEETLLLLDGGAETTRTVIGSIIRELALRPDQRRLLVEHPEFLATTAVEEFIRFVTPILNMRRTVTEEHELHGQTLREGEQVVLMYAAANRDPRAFTDPDRLDVTRPDNRHVAFGFGTHFCLGAWLARLELRVMFEELLRRIPEWELVDPDEPQIVPGTFARAYDQIRIRYQPA